MAFAHASEINTYTTTYSDYGKSVTDKSQVRTSDLGVEYSWNNMIEHSKLATTITTDKEFKTNVTIPGNKIKDINHELATIWLEHTLNTLLQNNDRWLYITIQKSERYLLTLYESSEYRTFISNYLLLVRNNDDYINSNADTRSRLIKLLERYAKSNRLTADRIKFIREARAMGLSPSGA